MASIFEGLAEHVRRRSGQKGEIEQERDRLLEQMELARQAVHLLLAFRLFVVVVAVDSRWLLPSLEKGYPDFLVLDWDNAGDGGGSLARWASTPQSYLEKIFQIPLHIRPMSQSGFSALLVGRSHEAGLIFQALMDHSGRKTWRLFVEGLVPSGGRGSEARIKNEAIGSIPAAEVPRWRQLTECLAGLESLSGETLATFQRWAPRVARYAFYPIRLDRAADSDR